MGRPKGSANSTKKKKVKDPNRPKRPTSAYFYYVAYQRSELEKQGKKITKVSDWTKEVSAKWRQLKEDERLPFDKKALTDKERYNREMYAYKGKDANKPKRPMSAYFLWLAEFRVKMKESFAENRDLLRAAGEEWKKLTVEAKKPFELKAEGERKKYEEKMREYHQGGGAAAAAAAAAAMSAATMPAATEVVVAKKPRIEEDMVANGDEEDDMDDDEDDDDEEDDE